MSNLGDYNRDRGTYPEFARSGGGYQMLDPYDEEDMPRRYRLGPATFFPKGDLAPSSPSAGRSDRPAHGGTKEHP